MKHVKTGMAIVLFLGLAFFAIFGMGNITNVSAKGDHIKKPIPTAGCIPSNYQPKKCAGMLPTVIAPTAQPTEVVTEEPTVQPTEVVTEEPTAQPTEVVTEEPTAQPTEVVTETPTEQPTEIVTETPTEQPTVTVTETPTEEPTTIVTQASIGKGHVHAQKPGKGKGSPKP